MITGGKVTFGRTVQPAQYETKRAEVEIFFSIPEGASADVGQDMLTQAATMAKSKALEMVGLKEATAPAPAPAPEKTPEKAPEKAKVKTKADLENELKWKLAAAEKAKEAETAKADAAAIVDEAEKPQISTSPEDRKDPEQVDDASVMDDSLFTAEATQVSDADLRSHIMKVNEKLKNGPAIRGLIGKYVKPGQGATEIPMEKRAAFLVELDAL